MRGTPVRFVDFRGGVNTASSPYLVDQKEARDARNVVSTTRGSIRKRDGCRTMHTPAHEWVSLFSASTSDQLLGVDSTGNFYGLDYDGTASFVGSTATGSRWEFCQAPAQTLGPVFGVNGAGSTMAWVGGSTGIGPWLLTTGDTPAGAHLASHANRVFMGNLSAGTGVYGTVSDPGSALVFSEIGDPRTFPTENIVLFDPNDGDEITGLGTVGPYLLVFKRRKTFVVYDADTGANRRISDSTGCCAARSIAEGARGTFFLTDDRGVCVTNGTGIQPISDVLDPTLRNLQSNLRTHAAGIVHNDHYYLSVALDSGHLDVTLDFDTTLDSWWLHTYAANEWAVANGAVYGANASAALVSEAFVPGLTQDNGANFTAYWKGPWQTYNAPYIRKRLRRLHIDGTGPLDVYLSRDFATDQVLAKTAACSTSATTLGGTGTFGGSGYYGDTSNAVEDNVFTPGVARAWSVGFTATSSTHMEIDSYTMAFTTRRN
jgi:hypothetical protein